MSPTKAPRALMRSVREIMAEKLDPQARLDRVVTAIASTFSAEVSSLYLSHPDGSMELFATEGLNPEAVHNTHLAKGEGLVGLIAKKGEVINVQEAQDHPAFSYRPETGEEIYHSFLGVPVQRSGVVLGVVTVQSKTAKSFSEQDIEALETTAMIVAELIVSLKNEKELSGVGGIDERSKSRKLEGVSLFEGLALGHVVLHEPRVEIKELFSDDLQKEHELLDSSIARLRHNIDETLSRQMGMTAEGREIFETYRMFAHDEGWINRIHEAIDNGFTAAAAVERIQNDNRARLSRHKDPFWMERANDLMDLGNRLLRMVSGLRQAEARGELPKDTIIVARTMGAYELLDYPPEKLRGVVLEDASPASHVAIIARSLGVTAIGGVKGIVNLVDSGNDIIIDGDQAQVHIRPNNEVITAYSNKVRHRAQRQKKYLDLIKKPSLTKDGTAVEIKINAGLLTDMPQMVQTNANGIGLFRTELQFMLSSKMPTLKDQQAYYQEVLKQAGGKPVTFRFLDIGGDKILPYFRHSIDENPAMGWRGVRVSLDRPALLRMQTRALLRAAKDETLYVMVPMVSQLKEFIEAKELVEKEIELEKQKGHEISKDVKIGCMIEVPSILWQLGHIIEWSDFICVGTNDLFQFFYAADRNNTQIAGRYDYLNSPFLNMLKGIQKMADKNNCPVTLCGEMGSDPLAAMALIGMGYRSFSVAAHSVGAMKQMILQLPLKDLEREMDKWLNLHTASIRKPLLQFITKQQLEFS